MNGWTTSGDGLVFTVNVASAGRTRCALRYRNPGSAAATLLVSVNGVSAGTSALSAADGYVTHDDQLDLRAGLNTIAYTAGAGGAPNVSVDELQVAGGAALAARGATVPYTAYEAEDGRTNGAVVGPDRTYGTPAAEASQRKAIRLDADGAFVEQISAHPANALVVRFSMPDAPAGGGLKGALDVYVGQEKRTTLPLTSKYAWVYGGYPYGNDPGQGSPHRYFDEARALIGDVPSGATVRLQPQPGDTTPYYLVDLIELERWVRGRFQTQEAGTPAAATARGARAGPAPINPRLALRGGAPLAQALRLGSPRPRRQTARAPDRRRSSIPS